MKKFLRNNGLSVVVLGLFLLFLLGQSIAGHRSENEERREHGRQAIGYGEYVVGGEFLEATFENWQSEFLAVGALVILSIFLREKDSAQSKGIETPHARTGG